MKKIGFFVVICIFLITLIVSPLYSQNYTREYELDWDAVKNAETYVIEISKDPLFRDSDMLVLKREISETYISVRLRMGVYYFRIAGKNTDGVLGPWSEGKKISIEAPYFDNIHESETDLENEFFPETESGIESF
ncbi:MAG: hypothetical protein ACOCUI_03875, partial [bacterium]